MRIQLIQQKVAIGSQVTFTLKSGEKISGLLAELGVDYITLDVTNGQEILDVEEIKGIHLGNHVDESDSSVSTAISTTTPDIPDAIPLPPEVNPQLDNNQIQLIPNPPDPVVEDDSPDIVAVSPEDSESSENPPVSVEASECSGTADAQTNTVDFEEQASEQLNEIDNRFKNEIEGTKVELKPPDLTFPAKELTGWQNSDIAGKWLQIKNKYENAQKINEVKC